MKNITFAQEFRSIKKCLLIFLIFNYTNGIAQSIPNGSFENWSLFSGINMPDGWQTTAPQPSDTISPTQVMDNASGNFAILFQTRNVFAAGISQAFASNTFSISNKPNFFTGYYKSLRTGAGAAEIKATFKNNGTVIGTAQLTINTNQNNYTSFSLPINYSSALMPDEAEIYIASDGTMNQILSNKLWVDNLNFSSVPLSVNDEMIGLNTISIYPNPVNNILNIDLKGNEKGTIKVYNIFGQTLLEKQITTLKNVVITDDLSNGVYFLQITSGNKERTLKFIKE